MEINDKRVCYVITLATRFPADHSKKGYLTNFRLLFLTQIKIHTIRENYALWEKRFEKIMRNEAYISIREWSGKPYHSSQRTIMNLYKHNGIGLQKVNIDVEEKYGLTAYLNYETYPENFSMINRILLAKNNGLYLDDFTAWFKKSKVSEPKALIHFTNFKYGNDLQE